MVEYENGYIGPGVLEAESTYIEKYGFMKALLMFLGFEEEHKRSDRFEFIEFQNVEPQSSEMYPKVSNNDIRNIILIQLSFLLFYF